MTAPRADPPKDSPKAVSARRLRRLLDGLEEVLGGGDPQCWASQLASATPPEARLAFHLCLCADLRRGPGNPAPGQDLSSPGRILLLAQESMGRGALEIGAAAELRRLLWDLEEELHRAGAWRADAPPWWLPLPPVSPLEGLFSELAPPAGQAGLPSRDRLREAFCRDSSPRWLALPGVLSPSFCQRLHDQLEASFRDGGLQLEAAGVGALGRVSSRRTDRVLYLRGTEPEVLAAAPALAALVQWGLSALGDALGPALPDRLLASPKSAMLARYPAPSEGFHPHLDNPGGPAGSEAADNGRSLTLVLYLNGQGRECRGGELALWPAEASSDGDPAEVFPAHGGSGILFDSRKVPHQVRPVQAGQARWALTFWLNDALAPEPLSPSLRRPTVTELLLPVAAPPLPPETILCHHLEDSHPTGRLRAWPAEAGTQRLGIVCTAYRAGAFLERWCEHHLSQGFAHLVLIFDRLSEPAEQVVAARLRERYSSREVTLWSGEELQRSDWATVREFPDKRELVTVARGGGSSYAVAARQALNASAALQAARGEELGGHPLDWLLHLDSDELFHLEGSGRGGDELQGHFAAACGAGWGQIRYINHELLPAGAGGGAARFKLHPRLAAARLGRSGWQRLVEHLGMQQDGDRPYFSGYHNGKSAVAVAHGARAAGVHGWALQETGAAETVFLAGPSILHYQAPTLSAFTAKYLSKAASPQRPEHRPFAPSPLERAALGVVEVLQGKGASDLEVHRALEEVYRSHTAFAPEEVEILEEAGLLFDDPLAPG